MSGKRHRQKGDRRERELVGLLNNMGIPAKRVPLSGAAGDEDGYFSGDIQFRHSRYGFPLTAEVKARANGEGWKTIESWLGANDALFLKADHREPLVVLPWELFITLMVRSLSHDSTAAITASAAEVHKHGDSEDAPLSTPVGR